jgi:hypothetical protein
MAEHKMNFTEHDYDKWLQPTASLAIPRTDETCALIGSAWPVGSPNVRTRLDKQQSAFGYVVRHVYFYGQKVGPGR